MYSNINNDFFKTSKFKPIITKYISEDTKNYTKIPLITQYKKPETFEGVYDQENDKVVFDISKGDKSFSIFTIEDITIN